MIVEPVGNGVRVNEIIIDGSYPVKGKYHVVTHAHFDHMQAARRVPSFSNEDTVLLASFRGVTLYPHERDDIILLPAGHITGSSQILIENGRSVLVTGDFKMEKDIIERGAETEEADILIMDTTFGTPEYRFPSRKTLYPMLIKRIKDYLYRGINVILLAYELGKAQEITALLNSHNIKPHVTPTIHRINSVLGLKDRIVTPSSEGVLVLPPRYGDLVRALEIQNNAPYVTLRVSGWNPSLPLSSHADWDQTIAFVERVSPEMVITYGANKEVAAYHLKKEGFSAHPLHGKIEI